MGLDYGTAEKLGEIYRRHEGEFGKVAQKLLALTFVELGFRLAEERAVQGVDIDIQGANGEKLSFEVKTSQGSQVTVGEKDVRGLESRREADGYETFFAFLFRPHYLAEGWIIVPASKLKKGSHHAMRLATMDDGSLSCEVNARFPRVVERVYEDLMSCDKGRALGMMRRKHGI